MRELKSHGDPSRGYQDPAQKKAAEHATAQAIHNLTGVPPSQLRNNLADFSSRVQQTQLARPRALDIPPAPAFSVTQSQFDPRPFAIGQQYGNGSSPPFGGGDALKAQWVPIIKNSGSVLTWKISADSFLYDANLSLVPITNLGTFIALATADILYLDITYGTWPTITDATIKHAAGTTLPGGGNLEYTGTPGSGTVSQSHLRKVLATSRAGGTNEPPVVVVPYVYGALTLAQTFAKCLSSGGGAPVAIGCEIAWCGGY